MIERADKMKGNSFLFRRKKQTTTLAAPGNADKLLQYINGGDFKAFQHAKKIINLEDRLRLAEAIVSRYPPTEQRPEGSDEPTNSVEDEKNIEYRNNNDKLTYESWLKELMQVISVDPTLQRSIAEELIKKMGKAETEGSRMKEQAHDKIPCQVYILHHIVDSNVTLYHNKDSNGRTLFHFAAMHGTVEAVRICLLAIDGCCEGDEHDTGCVKCIEMLTAQDNGGFSPLSLAISQGRTAVVEEILSIYKNISHSDLRKLLIVAISSRNGNNLETMQALLTARTEVSDRPNVDAKYVGTQTIYRTDVINEAILRSAAKKVDPQGFKFLVGVGRKVLSNPDCALIHYVVRIDQVEAAKFLLKEFPNLATNLQPHPDNKSDYKEMVKQGQGSSPGSKVNEEKFSVLALYDGSDDELKDLIQEVVMERLPISRLREHLVGKAWMGREISLDVTGLASDPPSLEAFLESVRSELKYQRSSVAQTVGGIDGTQELDQVIKQQGIITRHMNDGGIEFERALKYVNIPSFSRELGERRTEAIDILQWLKDCKHVKRVFEVIVEDCRHCPSTEEDIESALLGLGVQHLDWRRTDLSVTSLQNVANDLKTLHLYSSGSLATIDHWLGPNGINLLNLDTLYIHIIQDNLVSETRAKFCESRCVKADLKVKTKPVVTIETAWNLEPAGRGHRISSRAARKQRPIEVTGLTDFIYHYSGVQRSFGQLGVTSLPHTKVAILDSGVNKTRFPLQHHNCQGRSFVWRDNGKRQSEASWWLATDPHGSQMASIISQLDPFCEFYFFQIADDMNYIESETVIKALREAIKCEVAIINCSFALYEKHTGLEDVLLEAKKRDIIIMCSTADEGENIELVWPAACYNPKQGNTEKFENVFPIVGCDEHGKFSKYANEGAGRFMFRGEDVDASSSGSGLVVKKSNVQGSSVATAIATGVASLFLACYNMVKPKLHRDPSQRSLVEAIFTKMSEPLRQNNTQSRSRLLVQPDSLIPAGMDDFDDDPRCFLVWLERFFTEIQE